MLGKKYLLAGVKGYGNIMGSPVVGFGDFNSIRNQSERTSGLFSKRDARNFSTFIDDFGLCEFDKVGPRFSYRNGSSPPTLSKLDRFIPTTEWMALFPVTGEKSLNFFDSDHRVLVL